MTTPASPQVDSRPYLLERVDEAAVVQLYADGFAALPLREKVLIYHLYQAAIAGRDAGGNEAVFNGSGARLIA